MTTSDREAAEAFVDAVRSTGADAKIIRPCIYTADHDCHCDGWKHSLLNRHDCHRCGGSGYVKSGGIVGMLQQCEHRFGPFFRELDPGEKPAHVQPPAPLLRRSCAAPTGCGDPLCPCYGQVNKPGHAAVAPSAGQAPGGAVVNDLDPHDDPWLDS